MKKFLAIFTGATLLVSGALISIPAQANPVTVSIDSGSKSLTTANTTRKLAVAPNGHIYALYSGTAGNHFAKSTDGGATFSTSSSTVTPAGDAEIAVSSNGNIFITYVQSSLIKQIKSTNGGTSWSSPYDVGSSTAMSVHTAVDREFVYVIARNGQKVFSSADSGATWVESALSSTTWAYSDIAVDPLTGVIYPFVDRPQVSWFASSDRGLTFSSERTTGKSVFYSVAALASNANDKYLFLAGGGSNLERLNLANNQVSTTTVLDPTLETSRTIAADGFGNVVTGGLVSGVLKIQVSQDFGATFAGETNVVSGLASDDQSALAINPLNGDVLVMYEKSGEIFLTRYSGLLTGYNLNLDVSYVDFSAAGTQVITLTNTSQASITISTIELSNSIFTQTNTCTSALAPNATCAITVTASTAGSATLRIAASGGIERLVPVAFGTSPATVAAPAFTGDTPVVAGPDGRYIGPELHEPGLVAHIAGTTIEIKGRKLDEISSITLLSSTISFSAVAATMSLQIPAALKPGKYDLEIKSRYGKLTHLEAIWIKEVVPTKELKFKSYGRWLNYPGLLNLTKIAKQIGSEYTSVKCIVNAADPVVAERLAKRACSYIEANRLRGKAVTYESKSTFKGEGFWVKVVANG
jgi:hypothetical protein